MPRWTLSRHRDNHSVIATTSAFRWGWVNRPSGPNRDEKAAHGKSRRAPVAARFSFIAFLKSATSSSASRRFSGSVVESSAFQAARSSSVAVSMEPIGAVAAHSRVELLMVSSLQSTLLELYQVGLRCQVSTPWTHKSLFTNAGYFFGRRQWAAGERNSENLCPLAFHREIVSGIPDQLGRACR